MPHTRQRSLRTGLVRVPICSPVSIEQQFFNPIRVKEVVEGQVPEHDENGIVAVLCVFGLPGPICCRQLVKPPDQEISILHVSLQRIVEVAEHQRIVRVVITRIVRRNDRSRINQHRFQSIEEQMMHRRKVTGMLVRGPLSRPRTSFQEWNRNLSNKRDDDAWRSPEGVDNIGNGSDRVHRRTQDS